MAAGTTPRTASVIVCCFAAERWGDLVAAVESLEHQTRVPDEVIVVVDHNPELLERAQRELPAVRVLANPHARGLSGARNAGVEVATGDVIAFMDDDATADAGWLGALVGAYEDAEVIAVGGVVAPRWDARRPRGFPAEFDWVVGCSYRGMPRNAAPVRNLIGANMSFRREVFSTIGGFRDGIGRLGARPVGCEETELCIRARNAFPSGVILYQPAARVSHRVPATRASWRYFASRCFNEGLSKALVVERTGQRSGLSSERVYALRTIPRGIGRGLTSAMAGDGAAMIRVAALLAGVSITTVGFVTGTARRAAGRSRDPNQAADGASLCLDVHGRAGIRVEPGVPGARQLGEMFAPFRVDQLEGCQLTVQREFERLDGMVSADGHRYRADALELPRRLQVIAERDGFRLCGSGELLAPVLALLDALVTAHGAAMVHAAALARGDRGVCIAAAGGAGKTSAAVGLARDHGFSFMGDDWAFVSEEGSVLGYAKPLFVRPHHRELFPELFMRKSKPLAPPRFMAPLKRLATAAHPVISRYPAPARVARRLSPEHMIVAPESALPGVPIARVAALGAAVFVERHVGAALTAEPRSPRWMASRLVGDFLAGLPRGARELQVALAAHGLIAIDDLLSAKAEVLRRALEDVPCYLLCVPEQMAASDSAEAIADQVERLLVH